jgi:hypothetical protein
MHKSSAAVLILCSFMLLCCNVNAGIRMLRLPYPEPDAKIEYIDLDQDKDPDVLRTVTHNNTPIQWIDDDDDMKEGDIAGDMDSDCLMIDINRDGQYGGFGDLIIDLGDEDGDGKADIEVIVDNAKPQDTGWGPGHYMVVIDTDGDGVFNYIDWREFKLKCWEHSGLSRFFEDYLGQSLFLKMHTSTYNIKNLEYNWENPFLFYDYDQDGLTEMAIRLCDSPKINSEKDFVLPEDSGQLTDMQRCVEFTKKMDWASIAIDLDNDSVPGNEFDFDMTINFYGGGFDYSDQVHVWKSLSGIREADQYFYDARWRQMDRLIYPDHSTAWDLVFNRGKWEHARFVYDEDDDCQRWERVELYELKDPFIIGFKKGGLDNHPQSDPSGDRGEWDMDNSGKGNLYLAAFDGRIHLYGAESGYWRIDQDAAIFQGYHQLTPGPHSDQFATVKYSDTDNNGFIDTIEYDLDADKKFEETVHLAALGIEDHGQVIQTAGLDYTKLAELHRQSAEALWKRAKDALGAAEKQGIDTACYALFKSPRTLREKYHYGYWLSFYIYKDLIYIAERTKNEKLKSDIQKSYYSGDWTRLK